jgi:hypothetical protein
MIAGGVFVPGPSGMSAASSALQPTMTIDTAAATTRLVLTLITHLTAKLGSTMDPTREQPRTRQGSAC